MDENTLDNDLFNQNQNPQIEYAGLWIRVLASIIDSFALMPLALLSFYNIFSIKSIILMVLLIILQSIYKPLMEWRYGATLGKMAVKIQVVNENVQRITLEQSVGRYIPWLISQILSLITSFYIFNSSDFSDVSDLTSLGTVAQNSPLDYVSTMYSFMFIFLIGSLVFDSRKQGVHDKIARTFCIKKKK